MKTLINPQVKEKNRLRTLYSLIQVETFQITPLYQKSLSKKTIQNLNAYTLNEHRSYAQHPVRDPIPLPTVDRSPISPLGTFWATAATENCLRLHYHH